MTNSSPTIQVFLRLRPLIPSSSSLCSNCQEESGKCHCTSKLQLLPNNRLSIIKAKGRQELSFDRIFDSKASQTQIYADCNVIPFLLDGINCCIMTYGQTNTGKTYTMYGRGWEDAMTFKGSVKALKLDESIDLESSQNEDLFSPLTSPTSSVKVLPPPSPTSTNLLSPHHINNFTEEDLGIVPRCLVDLFTILKNKEKESLGFQYSISCQMVQIYNEKIYDLMQDKKKKNPLTLREQDGKVVIVGVSSYEVQDVQETLKLVRRSVLNKAVRSTEFNSQSSRSHSVLLFHLRTIEKKLRNNDEESNSVEGGSNSEDVKEIKNSTLTLVDLAGSEKWRQSLNISSNNLPPKANSQSNSLNSSTNNLTTIINPQQSNGINPQQSSTTYSPNPHHQLHDIDSQVKEMTTINSSLHVLGNCIAAIVEQERKHIPFRDSLLTRLLQNTLNGQGKSILIATLHSNNEYLDENISTLNFASRTSKIKVNLTPNVDIENTVRLLKNQLTKYKNELSVFKNQMNSTTKNCTNCSNFLNEISLLEEENNNYKDIIDDLKKKLYFKEKEINEKDQELIEKNKLIQYLKSINFSNEEGIKLNVYSEDDDEEDEDEKGNEIDDDDDYDEDDEEVKEVNLDDLENKYYEDNDNDVDDESKINEKKDYEDTNEIEIKIKDKENEISPLDQTEEEVEHNRISLSIDRNLHNSTISNDTLSGLKAKVQEILKKNSPDDDSNLTRNLNSFSSHSNSSVKVPQQSTIPASYHLKFDSHNLYSQQSINVSQQNQNFYNQHNIQNNLLSNQQPQMNQIQPQYSNNYNSFNSNGGYSNTFNSAINSSTQCSKHGLEDCVLCNILSNPSTFKPTSNPQNPLSNSNSFVSSLSQQQLNHIPQQYGLSFNDSQFLNNFNSTISIKDYPLASTISTCHAHGLLNCLLCGMSSNAIINNPSMLYKNVQANTSNNLISDNQLNSSISSQNTFSNNISSIISSPLIVQNDNNGLLVSTLESYDKNEKFSFSTSQNITPKVVKSGSRISEIKNLRNSHSNISNLMTSLEKSPYRNSVSASSALNVSPKKDLPHLQKEQTESTLKSISSSPQFTTSSHALQQESSSNIIKKKKVKKENNEAIPFPKITKSPLSSPVRSVPIISVNPLSNNSNYEFMNEINSNNKHKYNMNTNSNKPKGSKVVYEDEKDNYGDSIPDFYSSLNNVSFSNYFNTNEFIKKHTEEEEEDYIDNDDNDENDEVQSKKTSNKLSNNENTKKKAKKIKKKKKIIKKKI